MRPQKARPAKNTHNQIIDAIFATVMKACELRSSKKFSIKVTDLPEAARGFTEYDLVRVSVRLNVYGVTVETMTVRNHTFHFIKP